MSKKKGMWITMGVVWILSLACVADAGDLMIWTPRTPAGGGTPGYIGSYLSQAAAVEYGPEATVGRDIVKPESRQSYIYETDTSGTQTYYKYDDNGENPLLYQVYDNKQTTVQKQDSIIYYPTK